MFLANHYRQVDFPAIGQLTSNCIAETAVTGKGFDVGVFLVEERSFSFFNIFITLLSQGGGTCLKEWMEEANWDGLICLLEGLDGLDCWGDGALWSIDIIEMMEGKSIIEFKEINV